MKNIFLKFIAFGAVALLLYGCKKDLAMVTTNGGKGGTLTASPSTLVLQKASLNDTTKVINFTFTKGNYGFSTVITNTLQIDTVGDNWVNPTSVTMAAGVYTQGYYTSDFNTLVLKLGLKGGAAGQLQVRVMYSTSVNLPSVYSNVVNVTVTPFYLTSWLYVVGSFQGYSLTAPDSLISATGNGIYVGVINFPASLSQFLILPAKSFSTKYATTTPTTVTSTTVKYGGANNLVGPTTAGQTIITFNLNTLTISFAAANYYSVIGSATAGGSDVNLKYVNDGVTGWAGTVPMTAGTFKIRQNHDVTYSWGDITPPDGKDATDVNGTSINVAAAGNYKVTFGIPLTATGVVPAKTATYTLVKQ